MIMMNYELKFMMMFIFVVVEYSRRMSIGDVCLIMKEFLKFNMCENRVSRWFYCLCE